MIPMRIRAFRSEDSAFGRGVRDVIIGGDGDDVLAGGSGGEVALGSSGDGSTSGVFGNDSLRGGPGGDSVCVGFVKARPQESDIGLRPKPAHEEARRVLPWRNLRCVVRAAKRDGGPRLSTEDLIQGEGIGQMEAVEKFDPDKRCRLSAYATWQARQSVGRRPTSKEDG